MSKITKSFRLDRDVIKKLDSLMAFYNEHMQEFSVKKATATDVVSLIIQKEYEALKAKGYNLK